MGSLVHYPTFLVALTIRVFKDGFAANHSKNFPLQTLCQVSAAQQGSLRVYQCQCVLPVNLYNEKIFGLLWFYLVGLFLVNLASLCYWVYHLSRKKTRTVQAYVKCLQDESGSMNYDHGHQ
jgi:hypothetical protein